MLKRYNNHIVTGTLNGVSNAAVTGGTLFLGNQADKVADHTLSAFLIITAATANITVRPSWQVSNNGSTWVTVQQSELNSAAIPVVTGAANATHVAMPPRSVYGYQYARCMLNVAGATGAAGDLYSIGYSYKQPD